MLIHYQMEYRPEIDGLRALAVLPVILFHAGFRAFSGGYIGVDVFFVISGYLITTLIVAEKKAGAFSLLNFYDRRARRILPALFLVLLACIPAAWLLLNPRDMVGFCSSLAAVPVFISNFFFWHQSGYFDTSGDLKPLLHTWSLAVEEQYYLLFPILITLLWKLGRQWIIGLLAVCAVVSLAAAEWGSLTYHIFTFYLLPTRGWEILAGALIAFYLSSVESVSSAPGKRLIHQLGSGLGVSLILYGVWAFDRKTPYPSLYTLAPVLGTALVILFAQKGTLAHFLLSRKLLVGIGLISYGAYLWHQPLFAFARYATITEPDHALLAVLVLMAFLLGFLSWKYIESPSRDRQRFRRWQVFLFGGIGSVAFIVAGLIGTKTGGLPQRFGLPTKTAESLTPNTLREACDKVYDPGPSVDFCSVGDRTKSPSMAVFGDSHSAALLPAFDVIGKTLGKGVTHLGLGGCPPLLGVDVINGLYPHGACKNLADRQFEYVKQNRIRTVFLVSRWTLYTNGEDDDAGMTYLGLKVGDLRTQDASRKLFREALQRTLQAYQSVGADVYIVAQVPQQKIDPYVLYYKLQSNLFQMNREATLKSASVERSEHDMLQAFTRGVFQEVASIYNAKTIVVDDVFCDSARCLIGRSSESFYFDADHLSTTGALKVVDRMRQQLHGFQDEASSTGVLGSM